MYALNGVVFHEGDSVNSGHYTSLCFNKSSNSWIYFDDDQPLRVLEDQEDQPNKYIQEEYKRSRKKLPYLVFYSEIGLGSTTSAVQIDDVDEINEQAEESEPLSQRKLHQTILTLRTFQVRQPRTEIVGR